MYTELSKNFCQARLTDVAQHKMHEIVCLCVCAYVCVRTYTYTLTYIHIPIYIHIPMYIYIYKHIYVCTLTLKNFCQARLIDAARRNMHGIVDLEGHNLGHGLYPTASFFNHRSLLRVYMALLRVNRVLSRVYMSLWRVYRCTQRLAFSTTGLFCVYMWLCCG